VAAVAAEWADPATAPVDPGRDLDLVAERVAAAAPEAEQAQGPEAQTVQAPAAEVCGRWAAAVPLVAARELQARVVDRAQVQAQVPEDLQVLAAGSAAQVLAEGQAGQARAPVGPEGAVERGQLENG